MRDYKKDPLKHNEPIPREEMYDLYINKNYSRVMLQEHFNVGRTKVYQHLKKYGFEKTMEQRVQSHKTRSLEKYGVEHPRFDKQKNKEMVEKKRKTCLERYGSISATSTPETQQKIKQTNLERYGTEYPSKLPEIQEKIKQTSLEKYGVEHPSQLETLKEKHRQTNLKKYGVESYFQTEEFKERSKEICLEKYGVEHGSQSKEIQEKIKQTNLERYGCEWSLQNEEVKQKGKETLLERYGVDNYAKTPEFLEKSTKTCQEKYGYFFASQSPEFRQKVANTNLERFGAVCNLTTLDGIKKKKETWMKNLGVDHPSKNPEVVKKQWETRKRNGTTSSSKTEKYIEKKLKQKFKVETNYDKDPRYPFHVDFYLPEFDLFIEYQGFEGHGKHPFDETNIEDLQILDEWINRAEQRQLDKRNKYLGYIETWTVKDVLKRNTAKLNKLRYIEFFTKKEFDNWYKNNLPD